MTLFMDGPLADVTTMACFYTFLAGPSFVLCFRRFLTSPRFVTTVSVLDWTQTTMYYYRLQLCTREQRLRKRGEPGHPPQLMPLGSSEDTDSKLNIILIVTKFSEPNFAFLTQPSPSTSATLYSSCKCLRNYLKSKYFGD